jgi:hypothetical protein
MEEPQDRRRHALLAHDKLSFAVMTGISVVISRLRCQEEGAGRRTGENPINSAVPQCTTSLLSIEELMLNLDGLLWAGTRGASPASSILS